jgi:toxin ParE1/3/4
MARFRLSRSAQPDVASILKTSIDRWGTEGSRRHEAILAAAMRKVAADPQGVTTRDRGDLLSGLRSLHIRHAQVNDPEAKVRAPVHVLYYRVLQRELIEILRVLHERMEPGRHISGAPSDPD